MEQKVNGLLLPQQLKLLHHVRHSLTTTSCSSSHSYNTDKVKDKVKDKVNTPAFTSNSSRVKGTVMFQFS